MKEQLRKLIKFLKYMSLPTLFLIFGIFFADKNFFLTQENDSIVNVNFVKNSSNYKEISTNFKNISKKKSSIFRIFNKEEKQKTGNKKYSVFRLYMPNELYYLYRNTNNVKIIKEKGLNKIFKKVKLSIDNNSKMDLYIKIRGNNSLKFPKKSFHVKSVNNFLFKDILETKKLYLLSLVYDEYGFKMEFSYKLLEEMGMFFSHRQFIIVYINDIPQGLYLAMERPEDAIKREIKGVVSVFRARYSKNGFRSCYKTNGVDTLKAKKNFISVHDENNHILQADKYRKAIDMDMYMKWLAFNSLVENGDSIDEFYIYEVRKEPDKIGIFKVFPWDYDDIQTEPAHPKNINNDRLMWAAEKEVDFDIIQNPILYKQYKKILKKMLTTHLTEKHLSRTLNELEILLNSIDVGNTEEEITNIKEQRVIAMQKFKERLFKRRQKLLNLLSQE
jgi:spore coat protein CotH